MSLGVTHVAMEATGVYSMPVYHALIEHGGVAQVLVCNAGHVKNVPSVPITVALVLCARYGTSARWPVPVGDQNVVRA
jgi:hypothetical protein